jgi:predicted O-linked N-acetylglucosamine transferase (SPINDLY family)
MSDLPDRLARAVSQIGAGRLTEAEALFRDVLRDEPSNADALHFLGVVLGQRGETAAAIDNIRRAIALRPGAPAFHNNLGKALEGVGDLAGAVQSYRRAVELEPGYAGAWFNLGTALMARGEVKEAEESLRRVLAVEPRHRGARRNLAATLMRQGRCHEGVNLLDGLAAESPPDVELYRTFITAILYDPELDENAKFAVHRRFEAACAAPYYGGLAEPFRNDPDPRRRIRIGWLSSDFRDHPLAWNLMPIFGGLDRERFAITCYADLTAPDGTTAWFRERSDGWRDVKGIADRDVAALVRDDLVDVLVILGGRFDRNRPLVAAFRSAPVQVSLFDAATSGMTAIDYLISDWDMVPAKPRERFTERVIHLPNFYVHPQIEDAPDVVARPVSPRGDITFASFNNPSKLNDHVLRLWARILRAVPNSRLLLKYSNDVSPVRPHLEEFLAAEAIARERLHIAGRDERRASHLAAYAQVDVALDPFPFNGSTATFEALWMGVPVVTLEGSSVMSRWAASLLRHAGHGDLIACSPDDYVAIATRLASDPAYLARTSATLRERVRQSSLCDGPRAARYFGRAMRAVWRRWCATQTTARPS